MLDDEHVTRLALEFRRGDMDSFRRLVESLSRWLIAVAYRYTGDWEWARDLTQETWIAVYEGIGRYDPVRSFRAWLRVIHRNNCVSHLRRAWVQREAAAPAQRLEGIALADARSDPQAELEREEFHRRLLRAVAGLAGRQRQVFTRVDLEDGDRGEVARELEMSPTTLRTTLHFARKKVAELMREEEKR